MEPTNLGSGLEVLATGGDGHGLHLALRYAERAVHLGPAHERRVLEVGPVVGAAGLEAGFRLFSRSGADGTKKKARLNKHPMYWRKLIKVPMYRRHQSTTTCRRD